MNITSLLSDVVKKVGAKTAIIENGQEISYRELWDKIKSLSAAFRKIGICENDRVALILPNSAEFIDCFFALLKINAIVSPLNPELTPFELKSILDNLNPHAIISLPVPLEKLMREFSSILDNKMVILHGGSGILCKIKKNYELKDLYKSQKGCEIGNRQKSHEDAATINYTYRGTGHPVGVVLNHKNYIEGIVAHVSRKKTSSRHRVLSFLSLSHAYILVDCVLAPLMTGATIVMSKNYMPRAILKSIGDFKINHFTAVPMIYSLLLQHYKKSEYDLSSLTCCITGGAYMPADMQKTIKTNMGIDVLQGYGLTECLPVTWNYYECNKSGTLGLPFTPDFKIRIVDEKGMNAEINQTGEIIINSPTVMQGYYEQKAETQKVLKKGWLYSGDYGYLDAGGYLHFVGLKKNIAKVGGNMVDLQEVKDVLISHPSISAAHAYSREDDLRGHVIVAKVLSHLNGKLTEREIKTYCGKYLSYYKVPKAIEFTPEVVNR